MSTSAHVNQRKTHVGLARIDLVGECENVRAILVDLAVAAERALRQGEYGRRMQNPYFKTMYWKNASPILPDDAAVVVAGLSSVVVPTEDVCLVRFVVVSVDAV